MERFEPGLERCGFGLLCLASSIALSISGIAILILR